MRKSDFMKYTVLLWIILITSLFFVSCDKSPISSGKHADTETGGTEDAEMLLSNVYSVHYLPAENDAYRTLYDITDGELLQYSEYRYTLDSDYIRYKYTRLDLNGNPLDSSVYDLDPYEDVNAAEVYASLCEKDIFKDLNAFSETVDILPSVKKAFRSDGRLPSLPFCAWYELLYSPIGHEQVFPLENLLKIAYSLAPEERFLYSAYDFSIVREAGICRFYDAENKTCSFDSPEFLTFLACMDRLVLSPPARYREALETASSQRRHCFSER